MRVGRAVVIVGCILLFASGVYYARVYDERARPAQAGWAAGLEGDTLLLARLVFGEANAEPFVGQVAVASVVLNRVAAPGFPSSIAGVIFQPGAFESVSNGQIWASYPSESNTAAAADRKSVV
jgi:N-acetylmuramoyl-L-alanine amidase